MTLLRLRIAFAWIPIKSNKGEKIWLKNYIRAEKLVSYPSHNGRCYAGNRWEFFYAQEL